MSGASNATVRQASSTVRLVHTELTRDQRAVCAYLHTSDPRGFKGFTPLEDAKQMPERRPTPFHLSRYMYVETTIIRALENFCTLERVNGVWEVKETLPLSKQILENLRASVDSILADGAVPAEVRRILVSAKNSIGGLSELEVSRYNSHLDRLLRRFVSDLPRLVFDLSGSNSFDNLMSEARQFGGYYVVCNLLFSMSVRGSEASHEIQSEFANSKVAGSIDSKILDSKIKLNPVAHEIQFLITPLSVGSNQDLPKAIFYVNGANSKARVIKSKEQGTSGELNRAKFPQTEATALAYLRSNFYNLNEISIREALQLADASYRFDPDKVRELLAIHKKYRTRLDFEFGTTYFALEASSFAEKWVCNPIGRLAVVLYPAEQQLRWALRKFADPSFEHSDGAVATSRLSVHSGHLILEEIQSDLAHLVHQSGLPPGDELIELLQTWRELAMHSVHIFAHQHGFGHFFAATPYRVFSRYGGPMHPDKARLYFEGWENMGGQLVYDGSSDLWPEPQYYYMFKTDQSASRSIDTSIREPILTKPLTLKSSFFTY